MIVVKRRHIDNIMIVSSLLMTAHLDVIENHPYNEFIPNFIIGYSAFAFWIISVFLSSFIFIFDSVDMNDDGVVDRDSDKMLYNSLTISFCGGLHQSMLSLIVGSLRYIYIDNIFGYIATFLFFCAYVFLMFLVRRQYTHCIQSPPNTPPRTPVSIN